MPASSKRIMVTGSRDWRERSLIRLAFTDWITEPDVTLVHGDARGADTLAAAIAQDIGWKTEAHPADWRTHGRAAGPIRNRAMLDSGIDHVVAFHLNGSRGTADAIREAKRRKIPVKAWIVHDGDYPGYRTDSWFPDLLLEQGSRGDADHE